MSASDLEETIENLEDDKPPPEEKAIPIRSRFPAVWLVIAMSILFALLSFWEVKRIPFHPDESTYLYMSADFEALLHHPFSLAWNPEMAGEQRQHYRGLDAPLTRYILGASRKLAGLPALPADWDWSESWDANREAGALPSDPLLAAGRLGMTLILTTSLMFIYLTGKALGGELTGVLAALLLGTNALILLHGRRAMAEGVLTTGVTLALWGIILADKRPWLAGLGVALAINAKHSAIGFMLVGLLAVCWPGEGALGRKGLLIGLAQYVGVIALISLALNPYYWHVPVQALRAAWQDRQELAQEQAADIARLAPEKATNTPGERTAAMLANLYITPPAFSDFSNYSSYTAQAEKDYLAFPGHNLLRGVLGGGLFLILTLFGMASAGLEARRTPANKRRIIILVLLATLAQILTQIYLVPVYWQRYVVPLVPLACLWSAFGIAALARLVPLRKA